MDNYPIRPANNTTHNLDQPYFRFLSAPVDIPTPPGYQSLVPFDKSAHRNLGVAKHASKFAAKLHAIYLTEAEIARASLDYPVVFAKDALDNIVPIALVGVAPNQNLMCDGEGHWPDGMYVPAYVRRYPFFMARLAQHSAIASGQQSLILVDENGLEQSEHPLIDEAGQTSTIWSEMEQLIQQYDAHQQKTSVFCEKLMSLGLFEKFDADFHPNPTGSVGSGTTPKRINGLLRIKRQLLERLSDEVLAALVREGQLTVIEAHLNSLSRFDRLLNLYAATSSKTS